jgi:hypothetical protein
MQGKPFKEALEELSTILVEKSKELNVPVSEVPSLDTEDIAYLQGEITGINKAWKEVNAFISRYEHYQLTIPSIEDQDDDFA